MSTYRELLSSPEWKSRRLQIISRDNHTCVNCKNEILLKDHIYGHLNFNYINKNQQAEYFLVHKGVRYDYRLPLYLELPQSSLFVLFKILDDNILILTARLYDKVTDLLKIVNLYYLNDQTDKSQMVKFALNYNEIETENYLNELKQPYIFNASDWLFVGGLNVHHEYYQDDTLPWDYPDSALTTLCLFCHENHHKDQKIIHKDKAGNHIGYLTPCNRCNGTGYLPEYFYHENGICFNCNGAKYLELI